MRVNGGQATVRDTQSLVWTATNPWTTPAASFVEARSEARLAASTRLMAAMISATFKGGTLSRSSMNTTSLGGCS